MPCYSPLRGYKAVAGGISWTPSASFVDVPMSVPCGQCVGCRLERSRQWAMRIMHEASLQLANSFITLTYDDAHLPRDGSLIKTHFTGFMKRLRKRVAPRRVSYFHCGEYGDESWRPHYHAILFNMDFPDRELYSRNGRGDSVWTSAFLDKVWGLGMCTIGDVTFESAAYVARYCLKKVTGDRAEDHYKRISPDGEVYWLVPEYASMSLKPAIGKQWFEKYGDDVRKYDGAVVDGRMQGSPRYYDKLRGKKEMKAVTRERVLKASDHKEDQTDSRLEVRRIVKESQIRSLGRKL